MSFYNVTNPLNFQVISDTRKALAPMGAPVHVQSSNYITAAATLTAAQVVGGAIIYNGLAVTLTLPTAAALLQLLQSGAYASQQFGVDDVLLLKVSNIGATTVTISSGSTASTRAFTTLTNGVVTIRFTNVTAGSEAYTIY